MFREPSSLLWDCLDAGPCSHTRKQEGDWHKHQGFHWIKHCMRRHDVPAFSWQCPECSAQRGEQNRYFRLIVGTWKNNFALKLRLQDCLCSKWGSHAHRETFLSEYQVLLYYCSGFTGQNTKQSKRIIGNVLEKALLWLNYCAIPAHLCLSLTENTILRLSCIFPSKGVNASGKCKDPLTTEKLSNAVSQRSCLFIFTGATDVCLVFSAHPSINLKTTHTWMYDMQLSAPR